MQAHFILYVQDQQLSKSFYRRVLGAEPTLDVEGMTEFRLGDACILGLMPISGIKKLLGSVLPDPLAGIGFPRAELYLVVDDALACHTTALANGATELSPLSKREWGDSVAYSLDLDGHVLALAQKTADSPG